MGLFSKEDKNAMDPRILGDLAGYGRATLEARRSGRGGMDSPYDWTGFIGPAYTVLSGPDRSRASNELWAAADSSGERDLAILGAYTLLAEVDANSEDPRFLEMCDASLELLRLRGFSSGHLTRYEADRWIETHGDLRTSFDGIVEVAPPSLGSESQAKTLAIGESRMLALMEPLPEGNAFFAEHNTDGTFVFYSERQRSAEDPARGRYEEQPGIFSSFTELLRAVGEYLRSPPYWYDDDLEPYFVQRRT